MIYIKVREDGNLETLDKTVSDSVRFETVKFNFPISWDGYIKTVVFKNQDIVLSVLLDEDSGLYVRENEVYVPHEVLRFPEFKISVFGVLGNSRCTTMDISIKVIQSGYAQGGTPSDPTPSEYEQLVNLGNEAKQIAQSVKTYANNTFAPAIKNTVSGGVLAVHDVSPIEHSLDIKLSSDTLTDFSNVGVSRLGKNLAYINDFSISGTLNETTPLGALRDSVLVRNIPINNGESYRISMTKPDKVHVPQAFLHNTPMYAVAHNDMYVTVVDGGDGIQISALNTVITNDNNYKYMSISLGNDSGYTAGDVTINISDLQLECGSTATDYEPYIEPQTVTANADGTVEGLTSLSPDMTVMTDTEGVVIDMTYNADTKMYIDNKLAEISTAIVNNV